MAQRRMFSKSIVQTDAFVEMPMSSQLLYFHLAMEADDDGFVSSPKKIIRFLGSSEDDYKILIVKRFVIPFDSGICVIKHWLIHNYIRKDGYNATKYLEEKSTLSVKENGSYTERPQVVDKMLTQVRLGKVSIEESKSSLSYLKEIPEEDLNEFFERFDASKSAIKSKAEDLLLWCESNNKRKKNYRAFLLNALKKDFPIRRKATVFIPEVIEEGGVVGNIKDFKPAFLK